MDMIKFIYQEISYMVKASTDISMQKIRQIFHRNNSR